MNLAVMREDDGVRLILQRYDDLWMIDRVAANETTREDDAEADADVEASTAVSRDEVANLGPGDRRRCHARHLRRLALSERGWPARLLWSMISNFDEFTP